MKFARNLLFTSIAVLAVGAVASAAASASEWLLEGKGITANQEVVVHWLPSVVLLATLSGVKAKVSCTGGEGTGVAIPTKTGEFSGGVGFTGCKAVEPGCEISASEQTKGFTVALTESGGSRLIVISPKTGTEFFTLAIEGCALEGEYKITGKMGCELSGPKEEAVDKNCVFVAGTDQEIKIGSTEATLEGELTILLKSGKRWSVS